MSSQPSGRDEDRRIGGGSEFRPPSLRGRIVVAVTLAILVFMVCVGVYLSLERRVRPAAIGGLAAELSRETVRMQLTLLLTVLLGASLVILVFAIGAYLLLRAGQAIWRDRVPGRPSMYVDAWSQYRLTSEQIARATQEEPDRGPSDGSGQEPENDAGQRT